MTTFTKADVITEMDLAIARPENHLEDGSIDWDLVDADVYMAILPHVSEAHILMQYFSEYADQIDPDE